MKQIENQHTTQRQIKLHKTLHYFAAEWSTLIVTNFFFTNKQYVKIKLMQNETNRWSIFFGKALILRPKLSQFSHF